MALSSMLPAVLSSASPLLAQAALPAAAHTSKLLARHMSSFIQAQAPKPAEPSEDQPAADRLVSTFELTFGPLAKHVVETRHYSRIMPEEATFVSLHQSATLLGLQLRPASHVSACSSHRRSALSELVERVTLETAAHSSCSSSRSLHSAAAATAEQPQADMLITRWVNKVQPRMKGGVRKLVLRQINRKIVARLARRFTIGIPVLGFYFVSKLLTKDCQRVAAEYQKGELLVSGLFATAVVADVLDLAAQATIIAGFAHSNFNLGLATATALLLSADKASLLCAALSFTSGVSGELVAQSRAAQLEEGAKST